MNREVIYVENCDDVWAMDLTFMEKYKISKDEDGDFFIIDDVGDEISLTDLKLKHIKNKINSRLDYFEYAITD